MPRAMRRPQPEHTLTAAARYLASQRRQAEKRAAAAVQSAPRRAVTKAGAALGHAATVGRLIVGEKLRKGLDGLLRWRERRATERPDDGPGPASDFLLVGHRGDAAHAVENTIPAFHRALERGANAIELDLCLTKDGHVVVWHDWDPNDLVALARQLGLESGKAYEPRVPKLWDDMRRHTHELTLAELRAHYGFKRRHAWFFWRRVRGTIPTFAEFMAWARTREELRTVLLDIKIPKDGIAHVPAVVDGICAELDRHPHQFVPVFLSPHEPILAAMRERQPGRHYCLDMEIPPGIVDDPRRYSGVQAALQRQLGFASVGRPVLTLGAWELYQKLIGHDVRTRRLHDEQHPERSMQRVMAWTINSSDEARRLIELGVDAMLTDDPRKIRRVLQKAERRRARKRTG
jgi:glycerophosphoryl diester phosphodiesterase